MRGLNVAWTLTGPRSQISLRPMALIWVLVAGHDGVASAHSTARTSSSTTCAPADSGPTDATNAAASSASICGRSDAGSTESTRRRLPAPASTARSPAPACPDPAPPASRGVWHIMHAGSGLVFSNVHARQAQGPAPPLRLRLRPPLALALPAGRFLAGAASLSSVPTGTRTGTAGVQL